MNRPEYSPRHDSGNHFAERMLVIAVSRALAPVTRRATKTGTLPRTGKYVWIVDVNITPIVASKFSVDGGAMFGLVPKPIWEKIIPPNERNAIPQNANCLLVELDDGRLGVVDTGCGDPARFTKKERAIHGLDEERNLLSELARLRVDPAAVDFVILSHLHWDHAGGTGMLDADREPQLSFPGAQHFIHGMEWDDAFSQNPLLGKSYDGQSLAALNAAHLDAVLLVTDAAPDILPGVRMARSGGHTEGHCVIVLTAEEIHIRHPDAGALGAVDTVVYAGDVCPTQGHLPLVYQTAFDTHPLATRAWKQEGLPEIADQRYLLFFDHDPDLFGATLARDPRTEFRLDLTLPVAG